MDSSNHDETTDVLTITTHDTLLESTSIPINFDELKMQYQDAIALGRRVAPRYAIQMEVIILTQSRSFRTTSVDVSASGALLKDFIPMDMMKSKSFDIILIPSVDQSKKRLLFRGKAVGGPGPSTRITFVESTLNAQSDLSRAFANLSPIPKVI